jgi:hypothetical protein
MLICVTVITSNKQKARKMNNETRKRIVKLAIDQGMKHTTETLEHNTLDSYEGKVTVNFCGTDYLVIGRTAKKHAMSFTNGYCSITPKTIGRGLY